MAISITLIIWLFICIYITGGNITLSWILFFMGIIGLIVYWGVKVKHELKNYENKNFSNYDKTNTIQTSQLPISLKTTPSNQHTLPIKKTVSIKQTNTQERIRKYKELFAKCDTVEEIINCYISFNNAETRLKPSEIYMLKHYIQVNSKFKFQEWTIEDIVKRVKKAISSLETVTSVVTHTDIETEKIELIHSLVLVLDRVAKNMSETTIEAEFAKEPIKLNKSLIQRKIELYKTLFADCMTVDEVIEKYIVNYSDVKFEKLEIMILRNYLQYHSIFKAQEWSAQKIERMVTEKLNDMEVNVQIENSSIFAIYDTYDVQSSHYLNETITQKLHPYSLFAEMRKMTSNFYYDKGADIFYKQAKFMESFEDSYEAYDEFKMYSPTYMSMNDNQLRTYFSWRTKVRKGVVLETSLSYVFVYIYELLHEVGSDSPIDGYRKLCSLSNDYSKYDKKIERYLKVWIHDYIIYNKLFEEISEQEKAIFFSESGRMYELIKAKNIEDSACFTEILNCFSNHNINKSVFFRDYKDDYCKALLLTYKNIEMFYLKNRKNTLFDKIFGVVSASSWYPYRSAVFFNYKITYEFNIRINEFEYYSYKEGDWKQYTIDPYKMDKIIITEIIKGTEYFMRKLYEYPFQLKYEGTTQILSSMIEKTIVSYCEENEKIGEYTRKKARAKKLTNKSNTKPAKTFQKTKTLKTRSFTEKNKEATKENLISDLLSVANDLSKNKVTMVEYKELGKYPITWFTHVFGSWTSAIEEAGLERTRSVNIANIPEKEFIDDLVRVSKLLKKDSVTKAEYDSYGKFSQSSVIKRVGSWTLAIQKAGLRDLTCVASIELSEEEYLSDIQCVANDLGVTQLYKEEYLSNGKHSLNSIRKKFGEWDVAAKKAGVYIEQDRVSKKPTDEGKELEINRIKIDRSKLDRIRAEADVVHEKLGAEYDFITQNNTEQIVTLSFNTISPKSNSIEEFFCALSDVQKQALAIILNGNDISKINELSQKHRIMPEILLDSINELSLDTLNDNIIDTAGELFVYDEYSNALQEILRGEN